MLWLLKGGPPFRTPTERRSPTFRIPLYTRTAKARNMFHVVMLKGISCRIHHVQIVIYYPRMKSPSVLVMMEPVSLPRLEGIARFAREHRWNLMLDDRLTGGISSWRGDGVIATLRRRSPRLDAVRKFRRAGIPVVDLTVECQNLKVPRVISDHTAIGRLAGEHFRERGFTNVAWFSSGWSEVHRRRYAGFSEAFAAKPPRLGIQCLRRRLAAAEKPVGILAYNDTDAAQVVAAARELGLAVPDEVSVLGIGDDPFLCENQSTPISSVRQDLARGAYEGAALLQRLMDGGTAPSEPMLIPPTGLTARASRPVRPRRAHLHQQKHRQVLRRARDRRLARPHAPPARPPLRGEARALGRR